MYSCNFMVIYITVFISSSSMTPFRFVFHNKLLIIPPNKHTDLEQQSFIVQYITTCDHPGQVFCVNNLASSSYSSLHQTSTFLVILRRRCTIYQLTASLKENKKKKKKSNNTPPIGLGNKKYRAFCPSNYHIFTHVSLPYLKACLIPYRILLYPSIISLSQFSQIFS